MKVKIMSFHDKYDCEIDIKITVNELLKQSLGNGYSNSYTFYKTFLIVYEEQKEEK